MNILKSNKPTILIVDDTPSNIQVLAEALQSDYRIKVAGSGRMMFEIIAKQGPPDLILLDVMMPELDGYTVCRRLKNELATQDIPIIFVTAKSDREDEEHGLRLGAVDYVAKPFHLPIVLARVRNHINLKLKSDLLERYARFDGLTNIPNRRHFDESLVTEWRRAQRDKLPLALVLLDIDHFKAYNDNYGHGAGDICLNKTAGTIAGVVKRPGDLVARYGGEEFVVMLPNTVDQDALLVAKQMCDAIEALQMPHDYSETSSWVTISAGVAGVVPGPEHAPATLLEEADQMLYQAKKLGRNRAHCNIFPRDLNSSLTISRIDST